MIYGLSDWYKKGIPQEHFFHDRSTWEEILDHGGWYQVSPNVLQIRNSVWSKSILDTLRSVFPQIDLKSRGWVSKVILTHSSQDPNAGHRLNMEVTVSPYQFHPVLPLIGHPACYTSPLNAATPLVQEAACATPLYGRYVTVRKHQPANTTRQENRWALSMVQVLSNS